MRRTIAVAILVLVVGDASADEDDSTPKPKLTGVRGTLDGLTARFTAGLVLQVTGPQVLDGVAVDLPHRGVITAATIRVDGEAHRLDLTLAADADATFDALQSKPGGRDRRWAARFAVDGGDAARLSIAVPHAAALAIELEISAPTCFHRDARFVSVPRAWASPLANKLVYSSSSELETACPRESEDQVWVGFPSTELAHRPPPDGRIGTIAGRLAAGDEHLARLEIDLANRLGEVPRDLATAIVVDGSRSLSEGALEAQRAVVESYLRRAPNSRVQIISFAHTARALLPGWTTASQALPRVDRELRGLALRNGSNVDAGLSEAASWLARVPGTHRIVLFTDELLGQRLLDMPATTLKRLVPADTVVHVVAVDTSTNALTRDETMLLAPLAQATDGMAVRGGQPEDGVDAELLVRPITLDAVTVTAPGWTVVQMANTTCTTGLQLAEGSSCTWWGEGDPHAGPIVIEGLVWGHRVARVLHPDLGQSRAMARELTQLDGLDEVVKKQVDHEAYAVNRAWSLVGAWGGRDGYADIGSGGYGYGSLGCGCGDGGSGSMFGTIGQRVEPRLDLATQVETAIAACHRGEHRIDVTLETTLEEIVELTVDVTRQGDESTAAVRTLHDCVEAALWDAAIAIPNAPPHASTQLVLGH